MLSRQKRLPDPAAVDLQPIHHDPAYAAALAELEQLEGRLAQVEERRKRARARARGAPPGRSPLERAKLLARGGTIPAVNPGEELAAADEEEKVLRAGIIEATARLNEVAREVSYRVSHKFHELHAAALLAQLRALDELNEAMEAAQAVRARLRAAGYTPSSSLLPALECEGAALLGHTSAVGMTPAWRFRKTLETMGIL